MNLKRFIERNRKILSVFFSIAFSALVVCTVVYGATTIGSYIATGDSIYATGTFLFDGTGTSTLRGNLEIEHALAFATLASSTKAETNNTIDFGGFDGAFRNIYSSSSAFLGSASTTLTLDVGGSGTSTFAGTVEIAKSAATTTLQIGAFDTTNMARGGCIALTSSSSTHDGASQLFLIVLSKTDGSGLEFTTSTTPSDCY